jgi:hypothetical protein
VAQAFAASSRINLRPAGGPEEEEEEEEEEGGHQPSARAEGRASTYLREWEGEEEGLGLRAGDGERHVQPDHA